MYYIFFNLTAFNKQLLLFELSYKSVQAEKGSHEPERIQMLGEVRSILFLVHELEILLGLLTNDIILIGHL